MFFLQLQSINQYLLYSFSFPVVAIHSSMQSMQETVRFVWIISAALLPSGILPSGSPDSLSAQQPSAELNQPTQMSLWVRLIKKEKRKPTLLVLRKLMWLLILLFNLSPKAEQQRDTAGRQQKENWGKWWSVRRVRGARVHHHNRPTDISETPVSNRWPPPGLHVCQRSRQTTERFCLQKKINDFFQKH